MILDIFGIDHVLTPSSQGQENNFNAPSGSDGSNMIKHDQTTPQRSIKLWQFLISDAESCLLRGSHELACNICTDVCSSTTCGAYSLHMYYSRLMVVWGMTYHGHFMVSFMEWGAFLGSFLVEWLEVWDCLQSMTFRTFCLQLETCLKVRQGTSWVKGALRHKLLMEEINVSFGRIPAWLGHFDSFMLPQILRKFCHPAWQ